MATKKKTNAAPKIPLTAAEKAARASLQYSTQLALEQNQARVRGASRGAFGPRTLRAAGTNLNRYEAGGFVGDPRVKPQGNPTPGTVRGPVHQQPKTTVKPKHNTKPKRKVTVNQPIKQKKRQTRKVAGGRYES